MVSICRLNLVVCVVLFALVGVISSPINSWSQEITPAKDYEYLRTVPDLIDECRAEAERGWERSITSKMKAANVEYGGCLKAIIVQMASRYYQPEVFEGVEGLIDEMQNVRRELYRDVYVGYGDPGSMFGVKASEAEFNELEPLVAAMAYTIAYSDDYDNVSKVIDHESFNKRIEKYARKWKA